jgi:hypothetical protein
VLINESARHEEKKEEKETYYAATNKANSIVLISSAAVYYKDARAFIEFWHRAREKPLDAGPVRLLYVDDADKNALN